MIPTAIAFTLASALALTGTAALPAPAAEKRALVAPNPLPPLVNGLVTKGQTSNTWSYARCQWSPTDSALKGFMFTSTQMTADLCATTCDTKGFAYAGMEYGNTCWCANSFDEGYAIADWECQKYACTGDKTAYCGGFTAVQVYARGAAYTASVNAASTSASLSAAAASTSASISASVASASASASASVASASASASAAAASLSASVSASIASASASASAAAAAATVIPSPWVRASVGCITDSVSARALVGGYTSAPDMTYNKCLSFCASKGAAVCGLEYSGECFAGDSLVNGASLNKPSTQCNMPCGGSPTQMCGGSNALTLFVQPALIANLNADLTAKAAQIPAPWTVASTACVAEGTTGRALTGAYTAAADMTAAKCVAYCNTQGYSLAGVEYSSECRCGNTLDNGASLSLPSTQCNMPCSGDASSICGGPNAMSLYTNPNAPKPAPTTSNGLTSRGCIQEVAGRALTAKRFDYADMTIDKCTAACKDAGYSMAGVEFGTECYCANTLSNGASVAAVSGQCVMSCPGSPFQRCGGPNAIQLYTL